MGIKKLATGNRLIVFYSGDGCKFSDPEVLYAPGGNVMLTYHKSHKAKRPERRFRNIRKAKRQNKAVE